MRVLKVKRDVATNSTIRLRCFKRELQDETIPIIQVYWLSEAYLTRRSSISWE